MSKNLFFFFFILPVFVDAQNLVPNGSFEQYTNCPNNVSQISQAIGWTGYSAELFNACSISGFYSVPSNFFGFQNASDGNAYAGIYTYNITHPNYREYVQEELSSPLIAGHKYYVSMKVSLAYFDCATNNLCIYFTNALLDTFAPSPVNNNPIINSLLPITDTVNWVVISGVFNAQSSFQYVVVGNCLNDSLIAIEGGPNCSSYYYIDEICVSEDSLECELNDGTHSISEDQVVIFPNPASTTIYFNHGEKLSGILINSMGQVVKIFNEEPDVDVSHIPNGIYVFEIKIKGKIIRKKQIIIH